MSCDRALVRRIALAVEAQGGDFDDVRDLVGCWERLHAGVHAASAIAHNGDEARAERMWDRLAAEFEKPLEQVVLDHLRDGGTGVSG